MKELLNTKIDINKCVIKLAYFGAQTDNVRVKILEKINVILEEQVERYLISRAETVSLLTSQFDDTIVEEEKAKDALAQLIELQKKYSEKLHLLNITNKLIPDQQVVTEFKVSY